MMKKYLPTISVTLLIVTFLTLLYPPAFGSVLGMFSLLFSLVLSTYIIIQKLAGTEHACAKILKEVGVMVITLILMIFLGGVAAILANAQVSGLWGEVAGLMSAIGVSFAVGYFFRKGMMRLVR